MLTLACALQQSAIVCVIALLYIYSIGLTQFLMICCVRLLDPFLVHRLVLVAGRDRTNDHPGRSQLPEKKGMTGIDEEIDRAILFRVAFISVLFFCLCNLNLS
jgi:hypothetical protein